MAELQWPTNLIRKRFTDYFKDKDEEKGKEHTVFTDRRLLFSVNDCDFVKELLGKGKLTRLCGTQMLISTEDIECAGGIIDTQTSSEMLVSIGDYLTEEVITSALDLLTQVYGLRGEHLHISYVNNETKELDILPASRVLQENFWKMGDTGLCGPRIRIYYDRSGLLDAASLLVNNKAGVEIWDILFVQSNREDSLKDLPTNYVVSRTMLATLACILQGKWSIYDTEMLLPIYNEIQKVTGISSYDGNMSDFTQAYRVVADHIKTLSFAIANDPGLAMEGRDYALRRVFYRMVRNGMLFLEAEEGFFSGLVKSVVRVMGDVFPQLREHEEKITEILQQEESRFCKIMRLVLSLSDVDRRENALTELTKDATLFADLAPTLWFTRGAFTFLLIEFKSDSPERLTLDESKRLSKLLRLMKCVAAHPDTRALFIKASVHMHICPYIEVESTNGPTAIVQKRCLGLLAVLLKDSNPEIMTGLLETGLLTLCFGFMARPSMLMDAREIAMNIIEKVFKSEAGLAHVTNDTTEFYKVVNCLAAILESRIVDPQLVKMAIRCYSRLSTRTRSCVELLNCLPISLQNGTFDAEMDEKTRHSLSQLLENVGRTNKSLHQ